MTDEELLEYYRPMVKFIADMCGPSCEVVLHNIKTPERSVIAIENGYLSGRGVGSPLTEFAKKTIESGTDQKIDYMVNYNGSSKGRNFLSSTYFIKNSSGTLIGMLCINKDLSVISELQNVIDRLQQQYNLFNPTSSVKEHLDTPVNQLLHGLIQDTINASGFESAHMKINEKVQIVHALKDKGILSMKGAISETARQLDVSEPTIYRYLNR